MEFNAQMLLRII